MSGFNVSKNLCAECGREMADDSGDRIVCGGCIDTHKPLEEPRASDHTTRWGRFANPLGFATILIIGVSTLVISFFTSQADIGEKGIMTTHNGAHCLYAGKVQKQSCEQQALPPVTPSSTPTFPSEELKEQYRWIEYSGCDFNCGLRANWHYLGLYENKIPAENLK